MKIKLDENLPEGLLRELAALGHQADNVRQEALVGRSDSDVWQAAQLEKRGTEVQVEEPKNTPNP